MRGHTHVVKDPTCTAQISVQRQPVFAVPGCRTLSRPRNRHEGGGAGGNANAGGSG